MSPDSELIHQMFSSVFTTGNSTEDQNPIDFLSLAHKSTKAFTFSFPDRSPEKKVLENAKMPYSHIFQSGKYKQESLSFSGLLSCSSQQTVRLDHLVTNQ